jgi:hypothetical protein
MKCFLAFAIAYVIDPLLIDTHELGLTARAYGARIGR